MNLTFYEKISYFLFFCFSFLCSHFSESSSDIPKDVDLRTELLPSIAANQTTTINDPKKRVSSDEHTADEPKSKKSKSEKIDMYVNELLYAVRCFINLPF